MFLACGFFLKNNSFNLLFQFVLTHQSVIIVVRLIRANLGTNEFSLNKVFYNHFQRLSIPVFPMLKTVEQMSKISGIGENKLRELMDSGELEYIQNGNRRLIADAAIWDWYHRAKTTAKPPARQGG